jgi:hypothetical protein
MKKTRKFGDGGETEEQDARNRNDAAEAMLQIDAVETPKVSAKPKVVTKEELAKSGLSLRDYMNKQQGLTRRGEATLAPSNAKLDVPNASSPRSAATPMSTDPSQRSKPKYQSLQDRENENAAKRKESGVGMYGTRNSAKDTRTPKRAGNLTDMLGISSQYASGGAVSSRADGIARRGKTRGRMC